MMECYKECYKQFLASIFKIENISPSLSFEVAFSNNRFNKNNEIFKYHEIQEEKQGEKIPYLYIKDFPSAQLSKPKIGVANFIVPDSIFKRESLEFTRENPFAVSDEEYISKILDIVNHSIHLKLNLLVLPECAVPIIMLETLIDKARKEQIALVFGLQHIITKNKYALNFQVTIMPFKSKDQTNDAYIDFRLKKHYSQEETWLLNGMNYIIPAKAQADLSGLDDYCEHFIYVWKNIWFSSINCYEFLNITIRSRFRSEVDLLVLSEWNKDISFFSNLIESSANDIHCYIVQSNSAQFGDSRICAPQSRDYKDIIKIKGGANHLVIADNIDIHKLRVFQSKEYELQKDNAHKNGFKPTPPDFDRGHKRLAFLSKIKK